MPAPAVRRLRLLLAPVYLAAMLVLVRPLLRKLVDVYHQRGRLTPGVLAAVLIVLLLSSYATEWMGLKYIFGAFLFGVVMPREGTAAALREEILHGLEPVGILVLLPVFFVVSGMNVDLSSIGPSGLVELCVILLVAVAGKFGGAFAGARLAGVGARRSGALATLMNTRGLTGIVILSTGLQLHILDQSLYSLMIVMALVTTMMAGPMLHLIYPDRYVQRDIAEADRAALGTSAEHRILVLIETPETAVPLVEVGAALAISRQHSELVLSYLVAHQHDSRLEVGTGLGGELLDMARIAETLQVLADRALARGAPAVIRSRFSQNVSAELPGYVAAAQPDTIVLGPGGTDGALTAGGTVQLVTVLRSLPEAPAAVAVLWSRGEGGAAALQVAAQLAVAKRLKLAISPGGGRRAHLAARLTREGIAASDGTPPAGAIVVTAGGHSSGDPHLAVLPGTREGSDDLDQWVQELDKNKLTGQR